jgi:drug/metabolite transporter (DMT)-like permease
MANINKGYALVLLAGVAWGSIGVLARRLLDLGLDPLEVSWLRGAVSFLGLVPLTLRRERGWPRLAANDLGLMAAFGLVNGALYNILYFTAVSRVGVTTAVILLYTAPAFAALFARLALREPLTPGKVGAVALSLAGCFLVVKGYDLAALQLNLPGVLAGLGAGITYGLYGIFGKKAQTRCSAWTTVFYCALFGTLFLTLIRPPLRVFTRAAEAQLWVNTLLLAFWGSLVPWVAYTKGVGQVEAGRAAVVASVEPVVGAALAAIFLGERLNPLQAVGMALVLAAVILAQIPTRSRREGPRFLPGA